MATLPHLPARPRRTRLTENLRLLWLMLLRQEVAVNRIEDGRGPSRNAHADLRQTAADVWCRLA